MDGPGQATGKRGADGATSSAGVRPDAAIPLPELFWEKKAPEEETVCAKRHRTAENLK